MTRSRKTVINVSMGYVQEIAAVISGLVLPRLIMGAFGSDYNGLVSSITQFLSCAVLLRAGIGGATRAALYKPIAEGNVGDVNAIIKATDNYMKKIGMILAAAIVAFALIYPLLISNEFGWFFTFSLFIIIGVSTFADSYLGITYYTLLQADQRIWVAALLRSICYVLNAVIAAILIRAGCSLQIVEIGSAVIYVVYPLVQRAYVKRRYQIQSDVEPNNKAIAQRWDAFWHQTALFVMSNTDIIVLTIFTNLYEVSVYSVYNLIVRGLTRAVNAITNSLEAPFGDMIAKKEHQALRTNMAVMETLIYGFCTVIYSTAILLVLQFVSIYTNGVDDVNYIRPTFAYIILIAQFFSGIRITYSSIVQAAGHYRQTRNGAIFEPILNIGLSILLVMRFGLVGVAIGTLAATVFRTAQYSRYVCKNLVVRNQFITVGKICVSLLEGAITIIIVNFIPWSEPTTYLMWVVHALVVVCIAFGVVLLGCLIFDRKNLKICIKKISGLRRR